MLKYWRIWLLVIMVFASVLALGLKSYPYGRNAVEIVYFSDDSPVRGVLEQGMFITAVNGKPVANLEDWNSLTKNLRGNITLTANGKDYRLYVNKTLGVDVSDLERTNINFGLDIKGGTRIVLKPKENATKEMIDQVISTMQTRANIYGLREMNFYPIRDTNGEYYVQIEVAGIKKDIVKDLLSTEGNFEAKVSKTVVVTDGKGIMQLGELSFPVDVLENDTIRINNSLIQPNGTFGLRGMDFEYVNKTQNNLIFLALVYRGNDIELVYSDPQHSGLMPIKGGYRFYFVVFVSKEGAQRFADITAGVPSFLDLQSGERYLDSRIFLYLDNELVSDLRISEELGGKVYQSPQITGSRPTMEEATAEMLRLQTILRSGALPTGLETVSVDIISPALGTDFFNSTMQAALLAVIAIVIIIFVRYRNFRIAIPMVFISLSEVVIIIGIAAAQDTTIWMAVLIINFLLIAAAWWKKHEIDIYAWVGALLIPLLGMASWTIDLPAIGGIIAAIGTGIDDQIIIADETLSGKKEDKKEYTLRQKIKTAFFIIFTAAATVIAAMIPLMSIGIGFIRGFAITTIVGVLVGILVTRPAYAKIVEILTKSD
jgi:preprotein translocase subunit SecD